MSDFRKKIANMDQEKKERESNTKKRHFTALDFFFVVTLLLCVLGIGFRGTIAEFFLRAEPTERVKISFKTADDTLNEALVEQLVNMKVRTEFFFDDKKHESFGHLESVSREGRVVKGTVTVRGRYTDSGLVTKDNRSLRVGETFNICAGNYTVCVQITEIPRK